MAPRRERSTFKEWLFCFKVAKDEIRSDTPDAPGSSVSHSQGDRNIVTQVMSLLSQHIIRGAAHDSSARTPPPRCHPATRVKLIARITAWFDGQGQQELLLWITGPAGVGKSAIVQTFAEYLVKSESLGASVFISRPNKRNNPYGIFITIGYQLAIRIKAYRDFIVERLSRDPELLHGDMQAQFINFIVEPFVEKGIGAGGKRWGILLDGFDELEGKDAQCNIIQLISAFVHDHPDAPLIWIIASLPELHISNTFDDDEVRRSCWTEYIPIDSTEACDDVERFLRSSFKMTQKKFRRSISSDWPSDTDFLQLNAAASGLFVYAEVVMQFIGDSYHADPTTQLEVLLSVIDRSTAVLTENPFFHLDALYHEILSSISSSLWPTAKQLLGLTIYAEHIRSGLGDIPLHISQNLLTLRGISILFDLSPDTVYACLTKCRSILEIPGRHTAHKEKLLIPHGLFADYLKDPSRSGDFHVGNLEDVENDVIGRFLEIWDKCCGDSVAPVLVKSMWHEYCSKWNDETPSTIVAKFHATLSKDVARCLKPALRRIIKKLAESPTSIQLHEVHMIKLRDHFDAFDLFKFVHNLMKISPTDSDTQHLRQVQFKDLKFGHFDWKRMRPAYVHYGRTGESFTESDWVLQQPHSSTELGAYVSELENLQKRSPELKVVIFGDVPKGRVAAFCRPLKTGASDEKDFLYYTIPYHE